MSESIRTVDRALDILQCFNRQNPELTLSQIAEQVGLNKSTVHRLLGTLEKRRFVQKDSASGRYQLGIRLVQMAYLTLDQNDLRQCSGPYMRRLCEQHRETLTLSILDEADVVFLDVIESPQRVKLAASAGQRMPAFATAAGKAILAYLPDQQVEKILALGMQAYTDHTILSSGALVEELQEIRKAGFAVSSEEYESGINAVAAPILDEERRPLGAMTVAGPAYRLSRQRMIEVGPTIVAAATELALDFAGAALKK